MDLFDTASTILDADHEVMAILHDREYRVRAYRKAGATRIVIRGAVRNQKPPSLYLADDPEPLAIHHMQIPVACSLSCRGRCGSPGPTAANQSGTLPCLRCGRSSRFERNIRRPATTLRRVSAGSITSSMKPRSAATYGLAYFSV